MPSFVMKVDRDRDLYVEWSSVVDNYTRVGTRDEMLQYLLGREPDGYTAKPDNTPQAHLRRADETGTSARFYDPPFEGSWEDPLLMIEQYGMLARADLGRYIDAITSGDEAAAYALIKPFEED